MISAHPAPRRRCPVAPAPANALRDATALRHRALLLTPERISSRLNAQQPVSNA
ncbi:hypothetical protein ACFY15_18130 [Streptomyces sp. NPDC001373]|uniref:hypothetical protein n=1 Tax=Streptomyces sp. NPDC001373 TaxID=3364565 RepID=UPI00368058B0